MNMIISFIILTFSFIRHSKHENTDKLIDKHFKIDKICDLYRPVDEVISKIEIDDKMVSEILENGVSIIRNYTINYFREAILYFRLSNKKHNHDISYLLFQKIMFYDMCKHNDAFLASAGSSGEFLFIHTNEYQSFVSKQSRFLEESCCTCDYTNHTDSCLFFIFQEILSERKHFLENYYLTIFPLISDSQKCTLVSHLNTLMEYLNTAMCNTLLELKSEIFIEEDSNEETKFCCKIC